MYIDDEYVEYLVPLLLKALQDAVADEKLWKDLYFKKAKEVKTPKIDDETEVSEDADV